MYKYRLRNGKIFSVKESDLQAFLAANEGAVLVSAPDRKPVAQEKPGYEKYHVGNKFWDVALDDVDAFKASFGGEDNVVRVQAGDRFNHITRGDYLKVADDSWLSREENMRRLLEKNYKYDKQGNSSGIEFVERGVGNTIEVILPGNDSGRYFDLEGIGGLFSGEGEAKFKSDYVDLINYIEDRGPEHKGGMVMNEDSKKAVHDAFVDIPWYQGDDDVAKTLRLMDFGEGYDFQAQDAFDQAIEVTLPNGSKQLFYTDYGGHIDWKTGEMKPRYNQSAARIIRFIESNPSNYTHTKEYADELNKINKRIDPILDKVLQLDPEDAMTAVYGMDAQNYLKTKTKIYFFR